MWSVSYRLYILALLLSDEFTGHEKLIILAKILHCDISINNLMIDNTNADFPRPGLLIDFDYAQDLDEERRRGIKAPLSLLNRNNQTAPMGAAVVERGKTNIELHRTVHYSIFWLCNNHDYKIIIFFLGYSAIHGMGVAFKA